MRKRVYITLFIILVCCIGTTLWSQSVAGTWVDSQYKVTLVLSADGTYSLQHPNGQSKGRCYLNGQQFCLQDATGTAPVCYTVVNFTANVLVLRDASGFTLNYQRQGGNQMTTPPAPPQTPTSTSRLRVNELPPNQVLAQKGGITLTGSHYNAGIFLTQFVIGQPVKTSEAQELKNKLLQEFNQYPAEVVKQLQSIGQSMQLVRQATDPLRIGLTRQELFSAFYQATAQYKETDKPLMIQVINRYVKVLAYDPTNKLVLTDRDAAGMVNYMTFNAGLMGANVQRTAAYKQSVVAEMIKNFPAMPLESKRMLCSASLMWQLMESNWNRLTPQQKQQYKNSLTAQMNQTYQTPQAYNNSGTSTPPNTKESISEQWRKFNANQNLYTMMNNMNLQSHATSLNIIENMGGTGNYWEVVDY
ncbi:MAG: hypothetical protein GY757_18330 [bacterium]|nr:hypothetical protein [bacterium]